MPKRLVFKVEFWRVHRKKLDIDNPRTFNEKLYYLLRYNEIFNKDLIRTIYDKNSVRKYVENKGLGFLLIQQIAVYYDIKEIDFNGLPNQFVLKISQGSHQTIICRNKSLLDQKATLCQLQKWLSSAQKENNAFDGWYYDGNPCIVCEKLLQDDQGKIPDDIKFFCCNGRVIFAYVDIDSIDDNDKKKIVFSRNLYDRKWNYIPISFCLQNDNSRIIEKPKNYDKMIEYAEILSKDFVFVRVDMYNLEGKVLFGELTPMPGMGAPISKEFDEWLGDQIQLPNEKIF